MKMGIGIGWPNATSGTSAPTIYSFDIYECGSDVPLSKVYSLSETFMVGALLYIDEALTIPVNNEYVGDEGFPSNVYYISEGLVTNTSVSCT